MKQTAQSSCPTPHPSQLFPSTIPLGLVWHQDGTALRSRPPRVWGVCGLSSREPSGIPSVQGATASCIQSQVLSWMCPWHARTSGVGLCLLLDGRFVDDSLVGTFFAALLPSEKPNRYSQDNTDAENAGHSHGKDDAQVQSCVGRVWHFQGERKNRKLTKSSRGKFDQCVEQSSPFSLLEVQGLGSPSGDVYSWLRSLMG